MTPWPILAPFRVSAVVPTTVQRAPATPTMGTAVPSSSVARSSLSWGVVVVVVVGWAEGGEPGAVEEAVPGAVGGGVVVVVEGTGSAPLPVGDPLRQDTPLR